MPYVYSSPQDRCIYCEGIFAQVMYEGQKPLIKTRDHIIPKYKGGNNRDLNKVYACNDCNHLKGHKTPEEFTQYLYDLIGRVSGNNPFKPKKFPVDRLRIILINNNKLIDKIVSYKRKLTLQMEPVKKKEKAKSKKTAETVKDKIPVPESIKFDLDKYNSGPDHNFHYE